MTSDSPAAPPTTPEEAADIVRSRYAQPKLPDGSPAQLRVEEFDIGYLVYPEPPPVTRATGPNGAPLAPSSPGGSKIVVSKATGETVTVPNFPSEAAIALYRRQQQGRHPGS
ncbi:hypothetical protein [Streptomyces sp. V3I7]|uniref:hypothetical protein n=1 Tax=Streptomyces sp. V3I7 TaxID=3042278 RepID=UPI002784CAA9|nr:hypothetical protein [Streptomyces sp. V3I7]MDQ0993400.1 hypothetical protein [Streptomyces sp. V3I7]